MHTTPPLDRIVPPSFVRKLKDTSATLGASVVLECRVSGSAPISVGWFLDGNEVISSPRCQSSFSDNVCTLNLSSLDPSDTGTYTCVAANVAGQEESSAVLTVQGQCPRMPCCFLSRLSSLNGLCLHFFPILVSFSSSNKHLFPLHLPPILAFQNHRLLSKPLILWKFCLERA